LSEPSAPNLLQRLSKTLLALINTELLGELHELDKRYAALAQITAAQQDLLRALAEQQADLAGRLEHRIAQLEKEVAVLKAELANADERIMLKIENALLYQRLGTQSVDRTGELPGTVPAPGKRRRPPRL
jgi:hypothetical protein